jgi:hypothetical protein
MNVLTVAKKNINKKKEVHEGQLLEKLCLRSKKKLIEIAFALDITYTWLNQIFKRNELPKKVKARAIDYFNLPQNFFEVSDDKLPAKAEEDTVPYGDQTAVAALRKQLQEKNDTIMKLQAEVIRLLNEVQKKS